MGRHPVENGQDISIFGIFSSPIESPRKKLQFSTVQPNKWSRTTSPSPYRGGLFYKFRDQILGLAPMEAIHGDQRSVLESNLVSTGNPQSPKRGLPQTTGISKGPTNDVRKRPKADQGHWTWAQVARSCIGPTKSGIRMKRLAQQ
jgi:hypothetical protein